jgi:hypothetical protein
LVKATINHDLSSEAVGKIVSVKNIVVVGGVREREE